MAVKTGTFDSFPIKNRNHFRLDPVKHQFYDLLFQILYPN